MVQKKQQSTFVALELFPDHCIVHKKKDMVCLADISMDLLAILLWIKQCVYIYITYIYVYIFDQTE